MLWRFQKESSWRGPGSEGVGWGGRWGGGMEVVSVLCHYRNDSTAETGCLWLSWLILQE